ncbi:MAG: RNA polymerase sigma factor RpoD/SigA [Bacteroidales bacterium]|jgi:RNA polymerase primary sigma factor|nr:RNA polymerase sigma factor RpoD/SigA [Bacteroidales bacterium]MDD3161452.1 RNA polymerase sigma factor RpoD/SigA [Bacteroidales bacterium]
MRQLKISRSITSRESEALEKYLVEIGHEEMVSINEEVELALRIRQGDEGAFNKLVRANLRFVVSVAKQYQGHGIPLTDLINEGNLGLITAARKFDETRGFRFISYAVWWIRQSIMQSIAQQGRMIRLPLNQVGCVSKIQKATIRFEQENQRKPSIDELSEVTGLPEDQISQLTHSSGSTLSVDKSFSDGEDMNLLDVLADKSSLSPDSLLVKESLEKDVNALLLSILNEREQSVVRMFFGIGQTPRSLDEISVMMNLTRERVRQIKEKALKQIKQSERKNILLSYLG